MKPHLHQKGFSLVEVTLALGIAAFCLIPLIGLMPLGINSNNTAIEQTAASNLATRLVADLHATPSANSSSPNFALPMQGDTTLYFREDGATATAPAGSRYRARVVTAAGNGGTHAATTARILVTWPAAADPTGAAASRFETVVSLNRN